MKRFKVTALVLSIILVVGLAAGCGSTSSSDSNELVIYSSRNENFVQPLLDKFQTETGITVKALHAGEGVFNRLKEEKNNVQADVVISNDIGALENLRMEGFLQGYTPEGIETIDEKYRADDNSWFALSARTRVFIYNKDLISEEDMPKNVWELIDPKWAGEYAITRGGNGGMIGHVSALRTQWGDEKTLEWLSLIKNTAGAITQGHGDIRRAVGAGEFKFGLVNNYYYHQQLREPENNNVGVIYPDQGEGEMGAVLNAAGVGFVQGSPNSDNAKIFLDWILKAENQREFSYASLEVPINPEIEAIEEAATINEYKVHGMPLKDLGKHWLDTKELIERSGLDLEIR
ncbi:extracellular solute-binding protein [Alkalicella caledoniensis]|uniref:Extracellular solute-binding protein n=1 Tax=Alkalicella caledoniensis TaxID=2731377 RepID=A0A7G9W550_ALKCA|nr:extracellular solute-binding protein [Alkalicella caledoniensis]QNO13812.1 extracellular solute-binding protein [Alkalicella caledoniensis]